MPFSTLTLNNMLNAAHGKATYTAPGTVYFGLSTTTPTAAGGNVTEPSGNGYARVAVSPTSFNTAASGAITNNAVIAFPTASGNWGAVTNVVAYDASTGGNLIFFGTITSQAVSSGVTPSIAAGAATSTLV